MFHDPGGWLADKKGERLGIAIGFASIGTSLWLLISMPVSNIWFYGAGWALAGMGVGLMMPAYQSLISKAVPKKVRGTAFGLFSSSLGLVSLPAPIGGQMWKNRATPHSLSRSRLLPDHPACLVQVQTACSCRRGAGNR
jgi:MFS family permease